MEKINLSKAVLCGDCISSKLNKGIDYTYRCENKISPCRGRITFADFGCTYGEKKGKRI